MKTKLVLMSMVLVLTVPAAFAENDAESTVKTQDRNGTAVTTEKSHHESVGLTGTRTVKDENRIVKDPKGLNNKSKAIAKTETKFKKNGDVSTETTTVDAAGTERTTTAETNTSKNLGGGYTRTAKETSVVDPRGMMNRTKTEVKEEEKVNSDGTSRTYKKEVDGQSGEGRIVSVDGKRIAAYRQEKGHTVFLNPVCPHLGCFIDWNFDGADVGLPLPRIAIQARWGTALAGPAERGLEPVGGDAERTAPTVGSQSESDPAQAAKSHQSPHS